MDVISVPLPEPPEPRPIARLLPSEPGSTRLAIAAAALVLAGLASGWLAGRATAPVTSAPPDIEATLQWMFSASLTYSAVTEDGLTVPPPADRIRLREVDVLDPVRGPILAVAELESDGRTQTVPYEVTTRRDGRAWVVEAIPLTGEINRPGS